MAKREPTNKLAIYLIKPEFTKYQDILKNHDKIKSETIDRIGELYYGDSTISSPAWVSKFFGDSFNNSYKDTNREEKFKIFNASTKAVFLISVENNLFALTFGFGYTMLIPGVYEERFGLKVVLNILDAEKLKSVDKKNMSVTPKLSKEQMTKDGPFANFGVDIEQDLIQGITGKSKDENFGKTVTGKDSLSISVTIKVQNIKSFLKKCYQKYTCTDYKTDFAWIDQVIEIKNPDRIKKMNGELIQKIKSSDFQKTWLSIPEIVPWEDVAEFKYDNNSFGDDIELDTYLRFLSKIDKENLSLDHLQKHDIDCISASTYTNLKSWKIYNCLYCEIDNENETIILSNGKWFQIEKNFAHQICKDFESFKKSKPDITLPKCKKGEKEKDYNERIARELSFCKMDAENVKYGGVNQKIEFCDLFTSDKKLIHVKNYGASSVLSHLFSQGLVSGELFLSDEKFRQELNNKLPENYKITGKPKSSDYEVVYAIIHNSNKDLDIPFFSKVNIRNAKRKLTTFGYKVSLLKIEKEE